MLKHNNKKYMKKGFTIVELLVVIVVIGILAAITIVSYTGITARANTAAAQSAGINAKSKAEIYYTEIGNYPTTFATLTGAASTTTYFLTGVSFVATANLQALASQPGTNSTLLFELCGVNATGPAASTSYATVTDITGVQIDYWKYDPTVGSQTLNIGETSGTHNAFAISCWSSGT